VSEVWALTRRTAGLERYVEGLHDNRKPSRRLWERPWTKERGGSR